MRFALAAAAIAAAAVPTGAVAACVACCTGYGPCICAWCPFC